MIKCIIVEDEIMARKSLEKLCAKVDGLELLGSFENAVQAIELVDKGNVDLMFLDVELPGMSGLDFLEQLSYLPQVVFITSNTDYAYEAFQYDVTDFLKKPVTQQRFFKAVERVKFRAQQLNAIASASSLHEVYIKSDGKLIRLPFKEILYFENTGDYIKVLTSSGNYMIHGSLKSLDKRIRNPRFLKIHRSYIVNMDMIKDIEDNTLVIGSAVIPISRAHKPVLMRSINIL